jgi:hypothetical protein
VQPHAGGVVVVVDVVVVELLVIPVVVVVGVFVVEVVVTFALQSAFKLQLVPTFEHPEEQLQTCSHSLSTPAPEHCS